MSGGFHSQPNELDLADQFAPRELQHPSAQALIGAHQSIADQIQQHESLMSLPAVLCDEKLIEEISAIPDKMGFKIGEVADMLGLKQYVLRYWESEFEVLKPKKATNNQRYYTKKDVENAFIIRKLLHRDRFSIEGARGAMRDLKSFVKKEKDWAGVNQRLESLHDRVDALLGDVRRAKALFI